jgi:hypothetical protein
MAFVVPPLDDALKVTVPGAIVSLAGEIELICTFCEVLTVTVAVAEV